MVYGSGVLRFGNGSDLAMRCKYNFLKSLWYYLLHLFLLTGGLGEKFFMFIYLSLDIPPYFLAKCQLFFLVEYFTCAPDSF